jgi:hypothetical protein
MRLNLRLVDTRFDKGTVYLRYRPESVATCAKKWVILGTVARWRRIRAPLGSKVMALH